MGSKRGCLIFLSLRVRGRGWNEEICLRATLVKISDGFEITPAYMRGLADRQPEKQKSSAPV